LQGIGTLGALKVALAIQSVSSLVHVESTQPLIKTVPGDLFSLTFNDVKVGISNEQMSFFKVHLQQLLPQIAGTIAGIPEKASLRIEDVADFVSEALAAQAAV
jgi:hypothetical protein